MVRQRYGTAVNAEVLEESVTEATQQVLTDRGLRPALQPKIDVVSLDPSGGAERTWSSRSSSSSCRRSRCRTSARSQLTRMKAEPAAETVDKALADIAQRNRTLEAITPEELGDRGAAKGEVLTVDYRRHGSTASRISRAAPGQDIESRSAGPGFIPGFSEQLEGMKPGETRTIEVTFPEDTAADAGRQGGELRGHRARR